MKMQRENIKKIIVMMLMFAMLLSLTTTVANGAIQWEDTHDFGITATNPRIIPINDTAVLVVYITQSYIGNATIGTVSGNNVTYNDEYTFGGNATDACLGDMIALLNETKFVITYVKWEDWSNPFLIARVGSISGTIITFGDEYVFGDHSAVLSISALNETKIVIMFSNESEYDTAIVGDVSGTTISFGDEYTISSDILGSDNIICEAINSTHFMALYWNQSQYFCGKIGIVSGNTISFGGEYSFNYRGITVDIEFLDSEKFVISYKDTTNYGTSVAGEVSGTSISYGSEYVFNNANTNSISIDSIDTDSFIVAYGDGGNSGYGTVIIGNVSGTAISFGNEDVFYNDEQIGQISLRFINPTDFIIVFNRNSDNRGYSIFGSIATPIVNQPPNQPTNEVPVNNSNYIPPETYLNVTISDPDGDNMTVIFKWENGTIIATLTNVTNNSVASIWLPDYLWIEHDTNYSWYVVVDDGIDNVTSSVWAFHTSMAWDLNSDRDVDYLDVSSLVSHYGESVIPPASEPWDIVEDGIVNYLDVSSLVSHYGEEY